MRFPFHLFKGPLLGLITLLLIAIVSEFSKMKSMYRASPALSRSEYITVKNGYTEDGNKGFVYFTTNNLTYPKLTLKKLNITIKGAVLARYKYDCMSDEDVFGQISYYMKFNRKDYFKNVQIANIETNGFNISKTLFNFTTANYQYMPSQSEIEYITENTHYKYVGDGWFYKDSEGKLHRRIQKLREYTHRSHTSFVFFGGPLSILASLVLNIATNVLNGMLDDRSTSTYDLLRRNCHAGDHSFRIMYQNATSLSTVAYRNGTTLNYIQQSGFHGKIYPGVLSAHKVMRHFKWSDYDTMGQKALMFIMALSISALISHGSKEFSSNTTLIALFIYTVRALIWNNDFLLNPSLAGSLFLGFVMIYSLI